MKIDVNIKKKDGKTVSISAAEKPAQKKSFTFKPGDNNQKELEAFKKAVSERSEEKE